jgi:hypothetical protein
MPATAPTTPAGATSTKRSDTSVPVSLSAAVAIASGVLPGTSPKPMRPWLRALMRSQWLITSA